MTTVFFDLETGGLTDAHPNIQIAALAVNDQGDDLASFERKLLFKIADADPKALEMNSYNAGVWEREAIQEAIALQQFSDFLKHHTSIEMTSRGGNAYSVARLAGYNAATFDGPRLKNRYTHWGMFLPAHPQVLCVLQRAQWWFAENSSVPKPVNMKLGTVCAAFGIDAIDAHDALADVRMTVKLAQVLATPVVAREVAA